MSDDQLNLRIVEHMGRVDERLSTLNEVMHDTKDDVKALKEDQKNWREHEDKVVGELRNHFDSKISDCHEDVVTMIKETHLDEIEVRKEITKAIKASEKRTRSFFLIIIAGITSALGLVFEYAEELRNIFETITGGK